MKTYWNIWLGLALIALASDAAASVISPAAVVNKSSEQVTHLVTNAIDNDAGTYWQEFWNTDAINDPCNEWMIVADLGAQYNVTYMNISTSSDSRYPCSVEKVFVCANQYCNSGETSKGNGLVGGGWKSVDITDTWGRYLMICGNTSFGTGLCSTNSTAGQEGSEFQELKVTVETSTTTTSTSSTTLPLHQTQANCDTNKGYVFHATIPAGYNYTGFNLSATKIIHANTTNVYTNNTAYLFGSDGLIVNVSVNKDVWLWIGSSTYTYTYPLVALSTNPNYTLTLSNFTRLTNFYNVSLKWDVNGSLWAPATSSKHVLSILCDSYTPYNINVTSSGKNVFYLATHEHPMLVSNIKDYLLSVYECYADAESVDLYLLNETSEVAVVDYGLKDYVNQFTDSYLQVYQNVNYNLSKVWQQKFINLEVRNVMLQNNTYYQYVLYTPSQSKLITWDYIDSNVGTRYITVTKPILDETYDFYDKLSIAFSGDYNSNSLALTYNLTEGSCSQAVLTVYLYNSSGTTLISSSELLNTNAGTITKIIDTVNKTYILEASVTSDKYGTVTKKVMYTLWNDSKRYVPLNRMPSTIFGEPKQKLLDGFSLGILIFGAFFFGAAYSAHAGLFLSFGAGLLRHLGFLDVPWSLVIFLIILAALNYITRNRL